MATIGEMKDIYTVARYVKIPGEAIDRFVKAMEAAGYEIKHKSERAEATQEYHIYRHLKYTDAIVDAPRYLLVYAETPGRTIQGARKHLEMSGVDYKPYWPDWAYENGHLTKSGLAELVHRAMEYSRCTSQREGS